MNTKYSSHWSRRKFLGSLAMGLALTGAAVAIGWLPETGIAAEHCFRSGARSLRFFAQRDFTSLGAD